MAASAIASGEIFTVVIGSFSPGDGCGVGAGKSSEHRAFEHGRGARVVAIVSADDFARRIKAGYRIPLVVQHPRGAVDLETTDREHVRRNDRLGMLGRTVERMRPVRFGGCESLRREPVELE